MARHTEPAVNNSLGALLQKMLPRSNVRSENTRAIVGFPGLRPDILITAPGRSPVVIKAEYLPASTVEADANSRLWLKVASTRQPIEAVIALRYPDDMGDAGDLQSALNIARLSYCVFTQETNGVNRFPESGWLDGSVEDLADLVRLVSVPQRAVNEASDILQEGIDSAAKVLDELNTSRPGITMGIARSLGMTNVPQTRRMACAIIANALIFHERIAGIHPSVKALGQVCGPGAANPKGDTLEAWAEILAVNYWPIFAIAIDILEQMSSRYAAKILRRLKVTAETVEATGVNNDHDLTGRVFQRLIADRKYLATFYTLPSSAALLARLAVARMKHVDWSNAATIGKLKVADFACGTGALLSAVYEQIAARHERGGGDAAALHPVMMEEVLYGCDVMPSAIHITGSTLSGMEPSVGFEKSRLYTLAYGRQVDRSVKIGSLELLQAEQTIALFHTSDPGKRTSSSGEETTGQIVAEFPDEGFDLVIMNPPFTRATNHEGIHADITNPAFAAFDSTREDQTEMGRRINRLGKNTCYNGNAGISSAFAALAHRKLKPGGVLALVLPLSVASGLSWQSLRKMLDNDYADLTVLSIAANGRDMSFSADTGMAECLVMARRLKAGEIPGTRPLFSSLSRRPQGFAHASYLAGTLVDETHVRQIEDGPYGGTQLKIGAGVASQMMTTPRHSDGEAWGAVRLADHSLAQASYALSQSKLWLPGAPSAVELKVVPLSQAGQLGMVHRDITGPPPRGPFFKLAPSPTATYPSLWNHEALKEIRMVCAPDSQLLVRRGMEAKAADVWATASRTHVNLDFTFSSQALAVAFTERESIGGRVWPNAIFADKRFDYIFSVWGNSTLGLLCHWWRSNRQQSSKAGMTIRSAESLPVLDFRTLNDDQLIMAESIFDEFRDKELQPAYLADADPNRALLDRRVILDLLGFDEDTYVGVRRLAAKWCAEPSVHGGKARPKDAKFVA